MKTMLYDWFGLNAWLFDAANGLFDGGFYRQMMLWVTELGDHHHFKYIVIVSALFLSARWLWRRMRGLGGDRMELRESIAHVVTLTMGYAMFGLIIGVLKTVVKLPRPFMVEEVRQHMRFLKEAYPPADEYYTSFPSGHAAVVAFLVVFLWPHLNAAGRIAALALAFIVCWSRLAIGMHFPADLVGGALIGAASAWFVGRYVRRMMRLETA